jgi:putative tricarboxylic transport membrane protein
MNTLHANRFPTRRHWLGYSAALLSTPFAAIANPPQRLGTLRIVIPPTPAAAGTRPAALGWR